MPMGRCFGGLNGSQGHRNFHIFKIRSNHAWLETSQKKEREAFFTTKASFHGTEVQK